jgi:hypothetical protein
MQNTGGRNQKRRRSKNGIGKNDVELIPHCLKNVFLYVCPPKQKDLSFVKSGPEIQLFIFIKNSKHFSACLYFANPQLRNIELNNIAWVILLLYHLIQN